MRSWEDYKNTASRLEIQGPGALLDIWSLAKTGNVDVLAEALRFSSHLDINGKDSRGYSPLMLAAYNGHVEATQFLVESCNADVNSQDLGGNSIIMGVAFKGHLDILKYLHSKGANLNLKNAKGQTAMEFALLFGRQNVVDYLSLHQEQPIRSNLVNTIKAWISFIK